MINLRQFCGGGRFVVLTGGGDRGRVITSSVVGCFVWVVGGLRPVFYISDTEIVNRYYGNY